MSLLSACAVSPFATTTSAQPQPGMAGTAQFGIHHYVAQLAKQLFFTAKPIQLEQSVAVGTFLPTERINGKNMPAKNLLGQQIQESFMTLATQAGLNVIEFKTTTAIKMQHNQDLMLSRQVSDINPYVQADYYLTGTYTAQQKNIVINARLIETQSQKVIAAATDVIPANVMWEQGKVMMNDKNIYRTAY